MMPLRPSLLRCRNARGRGMKTAIAGFCFGLAAGSFAAESPKSRYLQPATFTFEGRSLHTRCAFAMLTDEFFGGRTPAIKVLYTTRDITPAVEAEFRAHGNDEKSGEYENAVLVLFMDKTNTVWQVNLTLVLKGRTVGYSVASKPDELKKFGNCSFDGTHLRLRSEGTFEHVTWKVDDDLPVFTFKSSLPRP
jgi:hypothetical protein